MNRKAQIWVETVIYTLIGLALIAIVLTIITPRINEFRDRAVIEQTMDSLQIIDSKIEEVLSAPGNVRIVEFQLQKGELNFDAEKNEIFYILSDSKSLFSEPDVEVQLGEIQVLTTEGAKNHEVKLSLSYGQDITFDSENTIKKFSASRVPYKFSIKNEGFQNNNIIIDIKSVS